VTSQRSIAPEQQPRGLGDAHRLLVLIFETVCVRVADLDTHPNTLP